MKVMHAPVNIGNQPWTLSRCERKLGITSDLIVNYSTWLQYPYDVCVGNMRDKTIKNRFKRFSTAFLTPFKYDILHYYFGRSLMCWDDYGSRKSYWFSDLKAAKWLGRKVFMTLQGCDARIAGQSNIHNKITPCRENACTTFKMCDNYLDNERMFLIQKILPLCDKVFFLNPELGHYIPNGTFLPYANVDVENIEMVLPDSNHKRPLILHAPSDATIKGTQQIESALCALKNKYNFDYIQVKNVPHKEAILLYQKADLILDQLLLGWYGGFAVEAMAMGKPVLCNIRDADLKFIPEQMVLDMPILRIDPENIIAQIEQILNQRDRWVAWGKASREYVFKWHNPFLIAKAMIQAYQNPNSFFSIEDAVGQV
jgi:hypothetical protein